MVWIVFAVALRQQVSITAKSIRGGSRAGDESSAGISPRIADLTHGKGATLAPCSITLCSKFRETHVMQNRDDARSARDRPVGEDAGFTARRYGALQ
jgi:hypothetical protein